MIFNLEIGNLFRVCDLIYIWWQIRLYIPSWSFPEMLRRKECTLKSKESFCDRNTLENFVTFLNHLFSDNCTTRTICACNEDEEGSIV